MSNANNPISFSNAFCIIDYLEKNPNKYEALSVEVEAFMEKEFESLEPPSEELKEEMELLSTFLELEKLFPTEFQEMRKKSAR